MIGPRGCGKTEIARRLAKLADAPFVKVEATKFTEVGFHGRDVDEIIRDLVEASLTLTKQRMRARAKAQVAAVVEKQILDALCGGGADAHTRETFRRLLRSGDLDGRSVEVEVPPGAGSPGSRLEGGLGGLGGPPGQLPGNISHLQEMVVKVDRLFQRQRGLEKRRMKVGDARPLLEELEVEKILNSDLVTKEALRAAEEEGIVFIDEIDKIVSPQDGHRG